MNKIGSDLLVKGAVARWSASRAKEDLWMASASELGALLSLNEVSPVEILGSILGRIEAVDSKLNAFCHLSREAAQQAARQAEARARKGARLSALDGVPVHIKDNIFVADMPCTWGSRLYENHVASVDDLPVAQLRAAGAVIIGKTNTPEFALMGKTENLLFGMTRNPWDPSKTPGGSSGGAAAAVAAGMGPLGLATDAGGSIRRPAAYCGVFGLKTTPGKVARGQGFPATVHDFQTIGVIARDAVDVTLMFDVIAQPALKEQAEMSAVSVMILDGEGLGVMEPEVRQSLQDADRILNQLGHKVIQGPSPWHLGQVEKLWQFFSAVGAARIAALFDSQEWASNATAQVQALAQKGVAHTAVEYVRNLDELRELRYQAEYHWFKQANFILTPVSPAPAWSVEEPYPAKIGGKEVGPRACSVFAAVVNAAGLPAISVPIGLSRTGLPIGVQIIGPPGTDEDLLRLGRLLESNLAPL